jgi:hypothetical protein
MESFNWNTFKKILNEEGCVSRYLKINDSYRIVAKTSDNLLLASCHLKKDSQDYLDFETNFKDQMIGIICE